MKAPSMQMSIKGRYGVYCTSYFLGNTLIIAERTMPDEQKLMKKGRGWLIHVFNFVEEENGQLIIHDEDSRVVKDTCCITYLRAYRDA
jgi:hypothetical protein